MKTAAAALVLALAPFVSYAQSGHVHIGHAVRWVNPSPPLGGASDLYRCQTTGKGCRRALVDSLNQTRLSYGVAPLQLDAALSHGSGSCIGAQGHAAHMALAGFISHDQFPADVVGCISPMFTAGENVGASLGSTWTAISALTSAMLSEPHSLGCAGNHACNIISAGYTRIGVGLKRGADGSLFLSEDFAG